MIFYGGNMKIILQAVNVVVILLISISSYAEKMRIVVMDFKADGVTNAVAARVSELIRTEMINSGEFLIIERKQMDQIFKEQGFQKTGCTEDLCAVEIGKLLSARKILIGTVMKLGESIIINGRIVDVEKGVAEFGEKQDAAGEKDLYGAVTLFTEKLTSRIQGNSYSSSNSTRSQVQPAAAPFEYKSWYFNISNFIPMEVYSKNSGGDVYNGMAGLGILVRAENSYKRILHFGFAAGAMFSESDNSTTGNVNTYPGFDSIGGCFIEAMLGVNLMFKPSVGLRPYGLAGVLYGTAQVSGEKHTGITIPFFGVGLQMPIRIKSPYLTPYLEFLFFSKVGGYSLGMCNIGIGVSW